MIIVVVIINDATVATTYDNKSFFVEGLLEVVK